MACGKFKFVSNLNLPAMLKENFVEFLEKSIVSNWNKEALTDYEGPTVKYKEVAEKIIRIQLGFELAGIKPGDKIALLGKNSVNWSVVFLASVTYGAVIVPILPDFKPENIHHIVNHSDSLILFAGEENLKPLEISEMKNLKGIFKLDDFSLTHSDLKKLEKADEKIDVLFIKKYPGGLKSE